MKNQIICNIKDKKKDYLLKLIEGNSKEKHIWKAVNLLRGKTIRNENPIDVDCNNINEYYATLGEQLAPNSKREAPLWKGPSSKHDFVLKPIS